MEQNLRYSSLLYSTEIFLFVIESWRLDVSSLCGHRFSWLWHAYAFLFIGLGSLAASGNFTNGQWTVYVCFQQSMTSTLWTSGKIQWLWWLNSPFAQAKVTVYRQHVYASSETVLDDEKVQWWEPLSSVCDAKGEPCAFDDWRQGSWPMLASWV